MKTPIVLAGGLVLVMLAACSKQAPNPPATDQGAAAAASAPAPDINREEMVGSLANLIDARPQCQPFRDQLQEVGKASADALSPDEKNHLNRIVGDALAAGCSAKK
jgi:hypothetical protein